ncbi:MULTISPECIES: hypothetical protein [Micromonospora]|uniref:Uncharacterized protein n=1 Tax=Micromonospora chokoriensis TaxID=356851 RepID=A0A1C4YJF6_9ACTN|nr:MULTISPECIES: hypothetical protein [Micromonospora]MCZ7373797.1 hypothetical protein [Micromonospora sp. WMMC250]SCF20859.1 hypothetical protein GA0070612_4844 [Micromonospora chokoriensis]
MSPLARPDVTGAALGRCRIHRRPLLAEQPAVLAEQIATDRLARDSGTPGPLPLPQPSRRHGYCSDCVASLAAAAVVYLNGDDQ